MPEGRHKCQRHKPHQERSGCKDLRNEGRRIPNGVGIGDFFVCRVGIFRKALFGELPLFASDQRQSNGVVPAAVVGDDGTVMAGDEDGELAVGDGFLFSPAVCTLPFSSA